MPQLPLRTAGYGLRTIRTHDQTSPSLSCTTIRCVAFMTTSAGHANTAEVLGAGERS